MYIFPFFRFNNNQQLNMEDMLWKFPHIGVGIFKKLSNKNLAKSIQVTRTWEKFIINAKFFKQKVKYEKIQKQRFADGDTPLHFYATTGQFEECKSIINHVENKNPRNGDGYTPLHKAAYNGHLLVFKLIFDNVQDKNPKSKSGCTPLHEVM